MRHVSAREARRFSISFLATRTSSRCHPEAGPTVFVGTGLRDLLFAFLASGLGSPLVTSLTTRLPAIFWAGHFFLPPYRFSWMNCGLRCTSTCTSGESPTALKL